jgi:threonine/homoserine/homoserine lactone efflux protein
LIAILPSPPVLLAFLAAAFVLAVTPGPGVLYVVTRTLTQGRGAGLASVAGVALGNFANAAGAALGLAAVVAASATAFAVLKYAGAAYLGYLAFRAFRGARAPVAERLPTRATWWRLCRDGIAVAALNPKTALFFAALLPQFMQPSASPIGQGLALGALFVATAATSDAAYVFLAAAVAPALRTDGAAARRGRYLAAAVYLGLGVYAALSGSRTPGKP